MIKIDLADLIQIIPDIIGLFLPGYIVVALCNWLINNPELFTTLPRMWLKAT